MEISSINIYSKIKYAQSQGKASKHSIKPIDFLFDSITNPRTVILKSNRYYKASLPEFSVEELSTDRISPNIVSMSFNEQDLLFIKNNGECCSINAEEKTSQTVSYDTITLKSPRKIQGELLKKYVTQVSCGSNHSLFLTQSGMVYSLGHNIFGQWGLGSNLSEAATPWLNENLLDYKITDIATGKNHSMVYGVRRDNERNIEKNSENTYVFTWGDNSYGQWGVVTSPKNNTFLPVEVCVPKREILCVSCGLNFSWVLYENGDLFGFGDNSYHQVTRREDKCVGTPTKVGNEYIDEGGDCIVDMKTAGHSVVWITEKMRMVWYGRICRNEIHIAKWIHYDDDTVVAWTDENLWFLYFSALGDVVIFDADIEVVAINVAGWKGGTRWNANKTNENGNVRTSSWSEVTSKEFIQPWSSSISALFDDDNYEDVRRGWNASVNTAGEATSGERGETGFSIGNYFTSVVTKINERVRNYRRTTSEKELIAIITDWSSLKNKSIIKPYLYRGLPSNLRGKTWLLWLKNSFSITKDYFEIENWKQKQRSPNTSFISLPFPELGLFHATSPWAWDWYDIIRSLISSRPDIEYHPWISFIAGVLLLAMDKFQSYVAWMNIVLNPNIWPFYWRNKEQMNNRLVIFKQLFIVNCPELCGNFELWDIVPHEYFLEWNMCLFSKNVHIDATMRFWDIYLFEGAISVFSFAVALLRFHERKFNEAEEKEEIMKILLEPAEDEKENIDVIVQYMKEVKFPKWIEEEIGKWNSFILYAD